MSDTHFNESLARKKKKNNRTQKTTFMQAKADEIEGLSKDFPETVFLIFNDLIKKKGNPRKQKLTFT